MLPVCLHHACASAAGGPDVGTAKLTGPAEMCWHCLTLQALLHRGNGGLRLAQVHLHRGQ